MSEKKEILAADAELEKKAQAMLEEKEADSRMRTYTGPLGKLIVGMLCLWTVFQLYFTTIGSISCCLCNGIIRCACGLQCPFVGSGEGIVKVDFDIIVLTFG